ncbi:MAG: hypothetical protein MJ067_00135 [Oscillospiraceae bacterium]|nr:hypothetical protein [Oscillospiraceae bacterium]
MKKALSVLLVLVMLLSLCACGSGSNGSSAKGSNDSDDENLGVYEIKKAVKGEISVDVDDLFEDGFTIELKAKGKCKMNIDGQEGKGEWELNGKKIEISGSGVEFSGTLKKGIMTLTDIEDSGIDIILVLDGVDYEDEDAPAKKDDKDGKDKGETPAVAEESIEGTYVFTALGEDYEGVLTPDAMEELFGSDDYVDARIVLNSDGTGTFSFDGEDADLEWDETSIIVDDDPAEYEVRGNDLILTIDDMFMVFTKEGKKSKLDLIAYFDELGYTWDEDIYEFVVNGVSPFTGSNTNPSSGTTTEGPAVTFQEYVVVDNDKCTVKITGFDPAAGYSGNQVEVKVYLENKTSDMTLRFSTDYSALNGVSSYSSLYEDVTAGKKANATISFWDTDVLRENGMDLFTIVEIGLRVREADNYSADPIFVGSATIYPYGESAAKKFERIPNANDLLLIDEAGYSVTILDFVENDWGDMALGVYVENNTDKTLYFTTDNDALNGYMVDPYWGVEVAPGLSAFSEISFDEDDLAELNINSYADIEEYEATWRIIDDNTWTDLYKDVWTITFS